MKVDLKKILILTLVCVFSACGNGDDPGKTDKKPGGEGEVETTDCGNGQIDAEEVCDTWNVGDKSCALLGYGGGSLGCQADCSGYDVSACTNAAAGCGNNTKEGAEICDGTDLAGQTCGSLNQGTGMLGCLSDCSGFDVANCSGGGDSGGTGGGTSNCTGPGTYTSSGALNTNLADGEPCNFDSDCLNDCNGSYYCGADDVTPTTHAADLPLGAACDTNESCASNFCWMDGDSWICAETCAVEETAVPGSLACQLSDENSMNPSPLGGACVPTGTGAIGDACSSGSFDCASGRCYDQDFCTDVCDPADGSNCTNGSTCEFLYASLFGEVHICVPASEMGGATGTACAANFNCAEGNVCVEEVCTLSCPNGDECGDGTYCATDHPAGPICLSNDTLGELGSDCEFDSQCGDGAVCFSDGEESKCRALCPEGTCADGTSCVQAQTGAALDTVIELFDNVADTEADAGDDDSGEGYFSKLDYSFTADGTVYVKVSRYAGSPLGDYTLSVSTDTAAISGNLTEDESTSDNNSNANATVVTVGTKVAATFSAEEDVDVFSIALTGTGTLTLETGRSESGVCLPAGTSLQPDGAACTSPASCENTCFPFNRGETSFCTTACSDDTDCGGTTGSCVSFFDNTPPGGLGEGYCFPSGEIALGTKTFGETCAGPHECGSKLCLKHPYGENWVCGAACESAGAACESNAGVCSGSDATYNTACVPHLGGNVAEGGDCAWDADCTSGNVCLSNKCAPQTSFTRYDIGSPKRPNGAACNVDADCVSDDCSSFVCTGDDVVGCIGDSNNTIDSNDDGTELCDGTDVGTTTCADLGAGTGTLKCANTCRSYDLSECTGLANGQPCNGSSQCQDGSVCATPSKDGQGPGDTWFCATSCTGEEDTSCSGTIFATNLEVGCRGYKATAGSDTTYACLPLPGVSLAADPCLSGYFDCDSGSCWNESFCIADCEIGDTECGRDGACVSYTYNVETDTQIEFVDGSGASLADPVDDNENANGGLIDLYSSASYTDATSDNDLDSVWVKVESSSYYADVGADPDTGAYQLQLFTSNNPPPYGSVSLESELKEVPADNSSIGQAQLVDDLTPVRFSASLAEGDDADVDYFRVQLSDGEILYAATTYPLDQVCWPNANLGKEAGAECEFSFECAAGECFSGKCATECTGDAVCEAGFECDSFYGSQRSYCFPKLTFNDDCEASALGNALDTPSCPNNLCLTRAGDTFWCSESCETEGAECGNQDEEGDYDGECWEIVDGPLGTQNICVPHLGGSVADAGSCIVNADCASNCCNQSDGTCSGDSTACNGS